jgi:hypothetical protein
VDPPADAVRRLQNQQVRYPSFRQPLPRRDPCIDKPISYELASALYVYTRAEMTDLVWIMA